MTSKTEIVASLRRVGLDNELAMHRALRALGVGRVCPELASALLNWAKHDTAETVEALWKLVWEDPSVIRELTPCLKPM
jgi:hypothetical protein